MSGALAGAIWANVGRLAEPLLRVMLARRVRAGKEIAGRLPERRGIERAPRPAGALIWMHAASVGETISVLPVLHALAAADPALCLLLTTGTVTSAELAAARLPAGALHRFVPLDVPRWIGRFLDHWRPDLACFVESEIWPNTLAAARRRAIPLALLNARLSERSFSQWRRLPGLARRLFGGFGLVWARSATDAARLEALGAAHVVAPGDLKFAAPALPADPMVLAAMRAAIGGAPVWIAASLHPGEDAAIMAAHAELAPRHPGLVTILAPRHPGRGAGMAAQAGGAARRGLGEPPAAGLYIADTLGELGLFYRLAACAFVGGSLVAHGGQNPLEPARLGLPVAMGPSTDNFAQACDVLREVGALASVADAAGLAGWVDRMLSDPAARATAGEAGQGAANRWGELPGRSAAALLGLMRGAG